MCSLYPCVYANQYQQNTVPRSTYYVSVSISCVLEPDWTQISKSLHRAKRKPRKSEKTKFGIMRSYDELCSRPDPQQMCFGLRTRGKHKHSKQIYRRNGLLGMCQAIHWTGPCKSLRSGLFFTNILPCTYILFVTPVSQSVEKKNKAKTIQCCIGVFVCCYEMEHTVCVE